jgi:Cu+-exporting ATPase
MVTDPVCGAQVDEKKAKEKSNFGGLTYYFCGRDCKEQFDDSPEEFAGLEQTGT